jgi:glycosyltransferase involved in cell wall biosynthesis
MTRPLVTVVVCTYNRADFLKPALASLVAQQTGGAFDFEVLVVNNASTDGTGDVIADACRHAGGSIRHVDEPAPGISICRNRGIAEARGSWIAFFDDDQLADPHWLAQLMVTAERESAPCVAGGRDLALPENSRRALAPFCRVLLGEDSGGPVSASRYGKKAAPNTGNLLIHRTVFEKVGAFNPSLTSGEDSDLHRRMLAAAIPVWYNPAALVQHIIPPHRLEDAYFLWASTRHGWNRARWERERLGWPRRVANPVARLLQAGLVFLPRLAWGRLRGDREQVLETRCLLARALGYLRGAAHWNLSPWFAQPSMADRLEFRSERQLIGDARTP